FQFVSGDGSSAVTAVVGRLALAPRPSMSYLSHSTNPSARTFGEIAHVTLFIVRGSFSLVKSPVNPAGRSCRLKYGTPEKKNSLSFTIGPPIWAVVSQYDLISRGVNVFWRSGESDPVLSAIQFLRSVRYSTSPVNRLLPDRTMLLAATPVNSPYSAFAPSDTTCTCSTQL